MNGIPMAKQDINFPRPRDGILMRYLRWVLFLFSGSKLPSLLQIPAFLRQKQ